MPLVLGFVVVVVVIVLLSCFPPLLGGRCRNRDRRRAFGDEDQGPVIDESTLSAKELQLLLEAEELLVQDQISRLKKVTAAHLKPAQAVLFIHLKW